MREMRRVNEDRFALKGRKKRFLKGMMPGVFMRKGKLFGVIVELA